MPQLHATLRAPADFGLAIQQARMAQGISQETLALRLGLTQSAVSEIENGKSTIYLRRLLALMHELNAELTVTWEDDDAPRG